MFDFRVKQIGLLLVIVLLGCLIVFELRYFASSVLGGFALYVLLRKSHRRLLQRNWNRTMATTLLITLTFLFLTLIVGGVVFIIYGKLKNFNPQTLISGLQYLDTMIRAWDYNVLSDDLMQKGVTWISNVIPYLFSATGSVVANVMMMVLVLFFMLNQSDHFEPFIEKLFPLSSENVQLLKRETYNMILSNSIGIPLILFGQALTAGVAYWLLGAGDPLVWGLLTCFFGLIPVVGTAAIWLPLSINLFIAGHVWQSIVLVAVGAGIIASVDNLVRIVFMRQKANIHPLITLFGVILGLKLFGFWGIIFGPLLISVLLLLVKIYRMEFGKKQ